MICLYHDTTFDTGSHFSSVTPRQRVGIILSNEDFQYFSCRQPVLQLAVALGFDILILPSDISLIRFLHKEIESSKKSWKGKTYVLDIDFNGDSGQYRQAGVLNTTFRSFVKSSPVQSHKITHIWSKHTQSIDSQWTLWKILHPLQVRSSLLTSPYRFTYKEIFVCSSVKSQDDQIAITGLSAAALNNTCCWGPSSLTGLHCSVSQYKLRSFRISYNTIREYVGVSQLQRPGNHDN